MLNVSTAFNEAFKSYERDVKIRVTIKGVTYTNHDIISASFEYGSVAGADFNIGSTYSNSLKVTFCKLIEGLKQLDEVTPELGIVLPDGTTEFVPMGVFIISEEVRQDRNENRTSIECSDKMVMLSEPYESKLSYPAKIRDVALEIANLSGVEVDVPSFDRLSVNTIEKPVGYTYREALGLIAQFEVGYATFNRKGLLAIKKLNNTEFKITPKEYFLKGLERNEIMFRPSGIEVRYGQGENDVYKIGNQEGSVIKLENSVMTQDLLLTMYNEIKSLNFYPYDLKWRGNPALEAGDWVTVTDTKDNTFKVPNLTYRLDFKGGLTAISTVDTIASNKVKFGYKKMLEQVIEYTNNAIDSQSGSTLHVGPEEPENAKEGDVWFHENGPDNEILEFKYNEETGKLEWTLVLSSKMGEEISKAIDEAKTDAQAAKDKADSVAVGLVDVQKDADEAKANAEQAKVDATNSMLEAKRALNKATSNETTISGLQVDIDETKNELSSKANQTDVNKLQGAVTNQQTQITQNASDIKTKAEKSEVDTINNTVKNQQSQINQNSESIKLKAEKQEVTNLKNELDGLEFSGTNILKDTKDFSEAWVKSGSSVPLDDKENSFKYIEVLDTWANYIYQDIPLVEKNTVYTLSFYAKAPKKAVLEVKDDSVNNFVVDRVEVDSVEWKRYSTLFSQPKDITKTRLTFFTRQSETPISIKKLKLEKGNRPTDWSPAPVDLASQSEVTSLSSSIDIQADQIKNLVTKTDGHTTQLASLTIESDRISQQVVDLQNVEIGGRNILRNSKVSLNTSDYNMVQLNLTETPLHEKEYTISLKGALAKDKTAFGIYNSGGVVALATLTHQDRGNDGIYRKTFKWVGEHPTHPPSNTSIIIYGMPDSVTSKSIIDWVKLEKGNKSTDWSPAPEDMATQSQITQLSDDILLRVQKGDVINQINISTEGILIDGKKVHITGKTTIDSAVIKNAMIADGAITNAKIQNATITSAKIAQLDAGKITTGELKSILITGANSYWDLSTGLFKMYNPSDNKQQITIQNGAFVSTDGKGRTITIKDDFLNAQSGNNNIYLDPKMILFRGEGYTRHLELQGQGLTISSFEQKTGQNEYLNAGLEIESLGTQSYIDFRTGGRTNDFDTRIKSVEGTTANGQGTLQIEAKRFETITNEVRFREAQSIDFNGALANNLPKNLIATAIKGSMSVLSIEKNDTGDNHFFNFRMRDLNHGIRDWGVTTWASDERLKTNIKPTELSGLGLVEALNVVQFDWKAGGTHESIGLIAQEVEKVYPKAVFENFSEIKQLKPEAFVPILIKAIQELKTDNERMNRQIIELQLGKGV